MDQDLAARVRAWMAGDPDPRTRQELQDLLAADDELALVDRFDGRLAFGTAGIRGEVGAGPNRLNRAVAIQTAAGLAGHVLAEAGAGALVVVGNDARPDSPQFALDIARVLVAAGLRVAAFDQPVPTPLVAHAALVRAAAAAVVVTASHNPPADNGIKVYAGNGIQIVPPTDAQIAARIDAVGAARDVPMAAGALADIAELLGEAELAAYVADVLAHRTHPATSGAPGLGIVATPLHGVGGAPLVALLRAAGHAVELVPAQAAPDGTFPTVAFPNPEEPGALDLLVALAQERGADLALANDPDADRLAVVLPDGAGGYVPLTGNQVGVLLADALLDAGTGERRAVASSIVSSPQLGVVAARHGARHEVTLTGFKWIWNALLALRADGWTPVLGYEEALGYSVGEVVRDKDGLSAALAIADLAAFEAARGRTLGDRLDDLARATGQWVSVQRSVVVDGLEATERIAAAFGRLRSTAPTALAGRTVVQMVDHLVHDDTRPPWRGAQNLLEFRLADAAGVAVGRALMRPSGTEPKVKAYVDLHAPAAPGPAPRADEASLLAQAAEVAAAVLEAAGLH